jgi:arginase
VSSANVVNVLGVPFDANSSYLRGPAAAPALIWKALHNGSANLWSEDGQDLEKVLHSLGDLSLPGDVDAAFAKIEDGVRGALRGGVPLICVGGDHSVTYPILRGYREAFPKLTILHFDAHPDLYDVLDDNRVSHACPFARIMEEKLAHRLVQVGIRTLNAHQREQARRFGVEIVTMRHLHRLQALRFDGPVYISFDVDVLDPAFAPGISHYEPGGMTVREVLSVIQSLRVPVIGADIVEYNPTRDHHDQTAMVCAKVMKEIAAAVLRKGAPPSADWD